MRMVTSILKIAHVPAFANVISWAGTSGYWTTNQDGNKLFLRAKDNRIWEPRALRGKNPGDVSKQDFDAIPKEESAGSSYSLWLEDFKREKSAEKLFDGAAWQDKGKILVDRLKKYIIKSKLDNATNFGLPMRYSVRLELFDKLLQQTNSEEVRSIGRSIGKKYRIITELLRESGKERLANKIDGDFYYHWNKIEVLFDFDPAKYNPKKAVAGENEEEEKSKEETLQNIADQFLQDTRGLLDAQMTEFSNSLSNFMKIVGKNNIPQIQQAYEDMASILMKYVSLYGDHPVAINAEKILQLPSMLLIHHKIHVDSTP